MANRLTGKTVAQSARSKIPVRSVLAPVLQPGDTVVKDNLSAHKVSGIRERIEAVGARLLYLPAYSPDFNPHPTQPEPLRAG